MLSEGLARHPFWILCVLAAALETAFFGLSNIRLSTHTFPDIYVHFGLAFCIYLLAVGYARLFWNRCFFSPELILAASFVFRMTLVFSEPLLSNDIYRYLWDGMVSNAGLDPYRYVPDSPHLIGLRDEAIFPLVSHRDVHTIYPPFLQFLFQGAAFFTSSPVFLKGVFVAFDMATILVLMRLLRTLGKSIAWVLIYAWNPLVIMETALNGHADVVAVFLFVLGLLLAIQARSIWAALALAGSFLTKFYALVFIPFLEDVRTRWKTVLLLVGACVLLILVSYVPYLDSRPYWLAGLKTYATTWDFNSPIYSILHDELKDRMTMDGTVLGLSTDNRPRLAARIILGSSIVLVALVWFFRHYRLSYHEQKGNLLRVAFVVTGWSLLASPTLHPWYLIWIVPLLCVIPNTAWILLTGLVVLSYDALRSFHQSGIWTEDPVIRAWIFIPFFTILCSVFLWKAVIKFRTAHPGATL